MWNTNPFVKLERMNRLLRLIFLLLIIGAMPSSICAQPIVDNTNYVLIYPRLGDGFGANILRFERDSIVVYTTDFKTIAKKDIARITVHKRNAPQREFIIGTMLGIYAMNYWLGTANGQPGAFLTQNIYGTPNTTTGSPFDAVGIAGLGTIIGGGLGLLMDVIDKASSNDVTYLFEPNSAAQADEWSTFQNAYEHPARAKLHFNISGGSVFPNISGGYQNQLNSAGYNTGISYPQNSQSAFSRYNGLDPSTYFNWLRTLSIRYSILDNVQVGIAYANLAEPSFAFSKGGDYAQMDTNYYAGQRLEGKGFYLTGTYSKAFGRNEAFELDLTGGIGLANINFNLDAEVDTSYFYEYGPPLLSDNFNVNKTYLSGMLSAAISYYLYNSFSFGLVANYFFVGTATAKAIPSVFLNEQKLNFGNGDIGFTMGVHF